MNDKPSKILTTFLFLLIPFVALTQNTSIDSLKKLLQTQQKDTSKINTLNSLGSAYLEIGDYITTKKIGDSALTLAVKIKFRRGEGDARLNLASSYLEEKNFVEAKNHTAAALNISLAIGYKKGIAESYTTYSAIYEAEENYPASMDYSYKALKIYEEINDKASSAILLGNIASAHAEIYKNDSTALSHIAAAIKLYGELNDSLGLAFAKSTKGAILNRQGKAEEALRELSEALKIYEGLGEKSPVWAVPLCYERMGEVYEKKGDLAGKAGDKVDKENNYRKAIGKYSESAFIREKNNNYALSPNIKLGALYIKIENFPKAREYFEKGLSESNLRKRIFLLPEIYKGFATIDSVEGNYKSAYLNFTKYIFYRDSLLSEENRKSAVQLSMQYDFDKKEAINKAEQDKKDETAKRIRSLQYFAIGAFLLIAVFLFIYSRQKQKSKTKIQKAYSNLKSTQAQLIQSEKMASLGELTAGIAHEIQNPLNFVNNFSDVNKELADELEQEIDKGNYTDAKAIAKDIKDNEEKINHHGKRADSIVKGMLQHSRSSTGQKEPTDINALADEYLRLSYHGLRAKDKSFNATMTTDFDESIGNINIIPQDIGRVILNLINNAFYTVDEKKKQNQNGYEPTVSVSTKNNNGKIEICVKDNGNGIPQKVLDKIFQPFFTTKPTGQGTGLGLSLSYDIVKAHGGEIKVDTQDREGTTFIIQLPVK